jgi:type II secretory pathway predicted ATPase ExeA
MFLDYYKLREQPFGVTPDPRYLYFSPAHREALASLFYGIETGRGFLSLVAEPGMGKTTLLFQLLQRWKGYVHSAFLFQTQCNSRELVRYLLDDLGLKSDDEDIVRIHSELNDFLYRETKAGRRVVVFIDEAQNLADSVLETVRLLSDFEAPDRKLLQIILAGQPELAQRLARPGLAQLRQRIAIQARLEPLPPAEVVRYIHRRLQVAGYEGPQLFTAGALELIAERSRGIPRLINNLCFNALSLGCAMQQKQIDSTVVKEAAADISMDSHVPINVVPDQQPGQLGAWRIRPLLESLYFWIRDTFFRRRLFQVSAVFLAISTWGIYLGTHARTVPAQPSAGPDPNAAHSVAVAHVEQRIATPVVKQSVANPVNTVPSPLVPQAAASESTIKSFTYVIQPKDTLRDLCTSVVGRYDDAVLAEIRKLNPELINPDHLDAGQTIRLPMSAPE